MDCTLGSLIAVRKFHKSHPAVGRTLEGLVIGCVRW